MIMFDVSESYLAEFVNLETYPSLTPESGEWTELVQRVRSELDHAGFSILRGFVNKGAVEELARQSKEVAPRAYSEERKTNVYGSEYDDPSLPEGHPQRIFMKRSNAFVAADYIPEEFIIKRLYQSSLFKSFLAESFGLEQIFEYADPFGSLVVNVLKPGCQHPWHFDMNEFTVSLLTQQPDDGGEFQFYPNSRSPEDEQIDLVRSVIIGECNSGVESLKLQLGDLQLFKGRYSVHRVAEVKGSAERHTAIFAYSTIPGIVGNVSRAKQLFGRVSPVHIKTDSFAIIHCQFETYSARS